MSYDPVIKFKLKNKVFSMKQSHLHQHLDVQQYLYEALGKFLEIENNYLQEDTMKVSINLGRVIGKTICVPIKDMPQENIFYAQRKGRRTFTKFVRNVEPIDCSTLTIVMQRNKENKESYKILTAYIGTVAEKEPLDPSIKTAAEFKTAVEFWNNHALTEKSQNIYMNTKTLDCPWLDFENRPQILIGNNNNISEIIANLRQKSYTNELTNIKNIV